MKSKLIKSLLVVILLIALGTSHTVISRQVSQDYSTLAPQQFTDDNTYSVLKTQKSSNDLIDILYCVAALGSLSLFYFIWKPKKEVELETETTDSTPEVMTDVSKEVKEEV